VNPPPFLISFPDKKSIKAALAADVLAVYWGDMERLIDKGLPPAVSIRAVACLFGFSSKFIGALSRRPEHYYRTFVIRKGKKRREIHAPKVALKLIQKWFGWHLAKALKFEEEVFGFVEGRSAPMAAAIHCGAKWVYSFDIANFFPTISATQVGSALEGIGYPNHAAALISSLCCYAGNLAQGSPASPVLSNLVFHPVDKELKHIAGSTGSRYTRYADDIVFSGTGDPPERLAEQVKALIEGRGWRISEEKERLTLLPQRLKVHGLLVHGRQPRLTKGYRNRIRAISHLLKHNKVKDEDIARFEGHLSYAKSVAKLSRQ
jgi:RNA-directed DNA polymerase